MRTTLEIDDDIFRRAKIRAAQAGHTLGELVTSALRDTLDRRDQPRSSTFVMPVFGDPSRSIDSTPASLADLRDDGR